MPLNWREKRREGRKGAGEQLGGKRGRRRKRERSDKCFFFKKSSANKEEKRITEEEKLLLSQAETVVNGTSFCNNLQIVEWKQN